MASDQAIERALARLSATFATQFERLADSPRADDDEDAPSLGLALLAEVLERFHDDEIGEGVRNLCETREETYGNLVALVRNACQEVRSRKTREERERRALVESRRRRIAFLASELRPVTREEEEHLASPPARSQGGLRLDPRAMLDAIRRTGIRKRLGYTPEEREDLARELARLRRQQALEGDTPERVPMRLIEGGGE